MSSEYIRQYRSDRELGAALIAFRNFRCGRWGLGDPFCDVFLRVADRCLYHSTNAWSRSAKLLSNPTAAELLDSKGEGTYVYTGDTSLKYEIEAYLASCYSLLEENLIGVTNPRKRNLLLESFDRFAPVAHAIRAAPFARTIRLRFEVYERRYRVVAGPIRNHAVHLNKEFLDSHGVGSQLTRRGERHVVTLPHVYQNHDGSPVDLFCVFEEAHSLTTALIIDVVDMLAALTFSLYGMPKNGFYVPFATEYGNSVVGIGPKGFELNWSDRVQGAETVSSDE